uniref:Odorant-binding protein 17 n=1 Tax=Encarsia formosa TaxID=32400 RepID=A0A514TTX3_ENCFO|nr:odorant-binding protein 17 [Encarsia formosa]
MKAFVLALVLCIATICQASTLTEEQKLGLKKIKEECIQASGVDAAVVEAIKGGGAITRDAKLDHFSSCFLQKLGVQREDGTINKEAILEKAKATQVDPAKLNEVLKKCEGLGGKDAHEIGANVFECFIKEKDFKVLD